VAPVRVGSASESPLPTARLIDASTHGLLLSFPEPVGLPIGLRVCVSVPSDRHGALHLIGRVVRVARGDDFQTYVGVAVELDRDEGVTNSDDADRWAAWLDEPGRAPHETCRSR
jgi:hypothetical protein